LYLPVGKERNSNKTNNMKAFVATVALAAVASAAPEPQVLVHHTNGAVVPEEPHANKVAKAQHLTAKANAYVSKPLVYTHGSKVVTPLVHHQAVANSAVTYTGYPAVHNFAPVAPSVVNPVVSQSVVTPVVSHSAVTPLVNNYVSHPYSSLYNTHLFKREAEADSQVVAYENYPLNSYSGLYNYVRPYSQSAVSYGAHVVPMVAQPQIYNYNVPFVQHPYSSVYDSHLINKREADAQVVYPAGVNTYSALNNFYSGHYNYAPVASSVYEPAIAHSMVAPVLPQVAVSPAEYSYMNYPYTSLYNTHHFVAKREAEPISPVFGLSSVYSGFNGFQTPTAFTNVVSTPFSPLNGFNSGAYFAAGQTYNPAAYYGYNQNLY